MATRKKSSRGSPGRKTRDLHMTTRTIKVAKQRGDISAETAKGLMDYVKRVRAQPRKMYDIKIKDKGVI